MERRARRRSTSLGDEDILSSTIDLPQASSTNRFSNFNNDRCVSTPHINVTGFLDDTFNSIDVKLREDFTKIKIAVIEWREIACSRTHTVDVINEKHSLLCAQIEQKISEVLLRRGDYSLVGELGSLKDRLIAIRKEAKQLARSHQQHEGIVPLGEAGPRDRSTRTCFLMIQKIGDMLEEDRRRV